MAQSATRSAEVDATNEVRLRGRLGNDPVPRTLPSGAEIVSFRLVIARATTTMTRGSQQKSDWLDCTAWSPSVRKRVGAWHEGDVVEIQGALRRRHYRAGDVGTSRVDVEVLEGRKVSR